MPGDCSGVVSDASDKAGGWQRRLADELRFYSGPAVRKSFKTLYRRFCYLSRR
ncbi:hypothetical protein CLV45_1524 [Hymenobacter chitinivorans DSM 11115]|uniref:Uncharacterized protein n=1 Tax=Hymenobacter chitinivorans DSM 11115 TaxID=1121954 RepID=A0A2M9BQ53_9BACT|nr:hypothetical protein CLV45_1524 [Hymenobacter chitinivorans DSM 11115]